MKANRQRLLTTISVVVDCWDRAHTSLKPKIDFANQVGAHIEDMRDILHAELIASHNKRADVAMDLQHSADLYKRGKAIVQEFRKGARQ